MSVENELLIKEIVGSIRKLYRAVYLVSIQMGRKYGLTGPQSGVLRILLKEGAQSSAYLSRNLFMTPSNITGIIDRLEKKGLVKRIRRERDRRVVLIELTPEGIDLSKSMPDPIENRLISGLIDLDSQEVEMLQKSLNRLISIVDAEEVKENPLAMETIVMQNGNISSDEMSL